MAELNNLPGFGVINPNTAVLGESTILDNYLRAEEMEFRRRQAQRQQDQEEIKNRLNAFDINTAGAWDIDMPLINKEIEGLVQFAEQYPEALSPSIDNLDRYLEFQRKKNDIIYKANNSKLQHQQYLEAKKLIAKNPDEYADPEVKAVIDAYEKGGFDRGDLNLPPPKPKDNIIKLGADYEKSLTTGTVDETTTSRDQFGQLVNRTTTTQQIDLNKLPALADATYDSNPSWKRIADTQWSQLTPQDQARLGRPSQVLVEMTLPFINADEKKKTQFRTDWQSLNQQKGVTRPEAISKRKELIALIQNKDPQAIDILRGLKYGGAPPESVEYVHDQTAAEALIEKRNKAYARRDKATSSSDKKKYQAEADQLTQEIANAQDESKPTKIRIKTSAASSHQGKTVEIEISDRTGGGFFAINQILNDLEGQEKISYEEFENVPEAPSNVTAPKTADEFMQRYAPK